MKKQLFIIMIPTILIFVGCGSSKHYAKSGKVDKVKWGADKEYVLSRIDTEYQNACDILPGQISYTVDYKVPIGMGYTITAYSETHSYFFNEKNQLYGVTISYTNGFYDKGAIYVSNRNNKVTKKLNAILGKADNSKTEVEDFNKMADKLKVADKKQIKNIDLKVEITTNTWNPKQNRKKLPNTIAETKYFIMYSDGSQFQEFKEEYINKTFESKNSSIFDAVLSDNIAEIEKAIESVEDINQSSKLTLGGTEYENATPLLVSILKKKQSTAQYLINNGADLNIKYKMEYFNGNSILILAISKELEDIALLMIEKGVDVSSRIEGGQFDQYSALHIAAETGNTKIINALLDKNVDIDIKTKDGKTPLDIAMTNKNDAASVLLVNKGAKIDCNKMVEGKSQLILSLSRKMKEFSKLLVEKGADVNAEVELTNFNGNSQLIYAILLKNYELAKTMIEKGADVNAKIKDGKIQDYTPLHAAAEMNNIKLVKLLLEKGADKNAKTAKGFTPAQSTKNSEIKKLLGE